MLYDAEEGELTLALTGDSMLTRKLSVHQEKDFLDMVRLLKEADVAFTNLEAVVHEYDSPPGYQPGTYTAAEPASLEELKWAGMSMVSCANNHSFDYGEGGMLSTIAHLDRVGLAHSGTGRYRSEARAPCYLDTPKGRVALVSATSSFFGAASIAGAQRPDSRGRPGLSALRYTTLYTVDKPAFEELRRVSEGIGYETEKAEARNFGFSGQPEAEPQGRLDFLGNTFILGDGISVSSEAHQGDQDDILKWICEARRQADWVLMSLHNHEYDLNEEEPAHFAKQFARACLEAGADVFVGHGPHFTRGIEIYQGKPIFYSLGNFIFQNETIRWLPADAYARFKLGHDATPADYFDARSAKDTRGFPAKPVYWQSVLARCRFERRKLAEIRLYPLDLGFKRPRSQRGRPLLAKGEVARNELERLQRLSKPFGVQVAIQDDVGIVRL